MITVPKISVCIATYNSSKHLNRILPGILNQTYPTNKIEILVIDGGSSDDTKKVAMKYGCKFIKNPSVEPVTAKNIAYLEATGEYLIYLDHDERLLNINSFKNRIEAFAENKSAKMLVFSGYKNPKGYPFISQYINDFGEPFSFFIYRLSKDYRFFTANMEKRYFKFKEAEKYTVFKFCKNDTLPIFDMGAGASMIDLKFFKKVHKAIGVEKEYIGQIFNLGIMSGSNLIVMKDDVVEHYSSENITKYLTKINWRIRNNVFFVDKIGKAGYAGVNKYQPTRQYIKKYLFIPYGISLVGPLVDSIYLVMSRRDVKYLLHFPLSIYTAISIVYNYFLKLAGYKPTLKNYDNTKIVR